ncbi:MAG: secondary thiamine-phosphate synthase enzyme [Armatimonadetes bacterium JP3_11]|jgi:secondary thiamine-phosphate synthase enzyme|nr:MAG: secondary thiamine-phosphate synthase enzyme [Armatimonadetes bacterium CP1_7O]OYT74492.1 MAG: secondary thiamine-phosphate synthase enzyme [Armatimonadetes bacterium JP3_11]RMH08273.1 MAG: YjbQ family protein [Armatimonadota bacterium]
MVYSGKFTVSTRGNDHMLDITGMVEQMILESGVVNGVAVVFVVGSTAAITTIEYEPGLEQDIHAAMERIAPRDAPYAHEARWHDDNGHSHIRASLLGPSLSVPIVSGRMTLGAWQQIVLIDFDTRPRTRTIHVQVIGE